MGALPSIYPTTPSAPHPHPPPVYQIESCFRNQAPSESNDEGEPICDMFGRLPGGGVWIVSTVETWKGFTPVLRGLDFLFALQPKEEKNKFCGNSCVSLTNKCSLKTFKTTS